MGTAIEKFICPACNSSCQTGPHGTLIPDALHQQAERLAMVAKLSAEMLEALKPPLASLDRLADYNRQDAGNPLAPKIDGIIKTIDMVLEAAGRPRKK